MGTRIAIVATLWLAVAACGGGKEPEHGQAEGSSGGFQYGAYGNYATMEDAREARRAQKKKQAEAEAEAEAASGDADGKDTGERP